MRREGGAESSWGLRTRHETEKLHKSARQDPERRVNRHRQRKRERKFAALVPGKTRRAHENTRKRRTHRCSGSGRRAPSGIGGGFAYLIMSNADAAFAGLDEATSRALRRARIGVFNSSAGAGSTIAGALLPLSPGSSSCSTDQTYRPTKPTRGRRGRGFLRNLTARAEQGGAEGRRAHSNGEEEEQSLEGEGPEALSFPLYRQCPPLLAHILASATSTPQQEYTCEAVVRLW